MTLDYPTAIATDSERMLAALSVAPDAPITCCGDWKVRDCAAHVGGLQHVIATIIEGRPTASFSAFKSLHPPKPDDPGLGAWVAEGARALVALMRAVDWSEPAWTFVKSHPTVAFWPRRAAHEIAVHRWDCQRAAGLPVDPIEPELASDGIDEYLDVFLAMLRPAGPAPGSGESAHVHCTDTAGEWLVKFPAPGELELTREHAKGDVAFRGPAEGLFLFLWNRVTAEEAGIDVIGDNAVIARWRELAPTA